MGKNAKIKAIKRMAKLMPVVNVKTATGIVPLNHVRNMKDLYAKHGAKGVRAYVLNVENHSEKLNG